MDYDWAGIFPEDYDQQLDQDEIDFAPPEIFDAGDEVQS